MILQWLVEKESDELSYTVREPVASARGEVTNRETKDEIATNDSEISNSHITRENAQGD